MRRRKFIKFMGGAVVAWADRTSRSGLDRDHPTTAHRRACSLAVPVLHQTEQTTPDDHDFLMQ
jgi:hypothetical protein